jgi:SPX domain protein involved in polyphosphate accumulation
MVAAGLRHALDHKLSMLRDVHLDTARHAQAAGTFWRLVDLRKCALQLRVIRNEYATFDGNTLDVHDPKAPDQSG